MNSIAYISEKTAQALKVLSSAGLVSFCMYLCASVARHHSRYQQAASQRTTKTKQVQIKMPFESSPHVKHFNSKTTKEEVLEVFRKVATDYDQVGN